MADSAVDPPPQFFLDTFERHVLAPLCTASGIVEQEGAEIRDERDAFSAFTERLDGIAADAGPSSRELTPRLVLRGSSSDSSAAIRNAYRETVMAVPHFGDVYGESLLENVAAELGPDLAQTLRPVRSISNTEPVKNAFHAAAERAREDRRAMCDALDEELASIERARRRFSELIGELDSTTVPTWYRETFERRLDGIASERQQAIREHPSPSSEEANLPEYLYADEPWTYPVLTAVTRVRESIVLS